jgi:ABC-2 type transport system ATP-binding protein
MQNENVVKFENVSKTYNSKSKLPTVALDSVSFELNKDEITGLIGPNGAGKTTLLRILLGFEQADNGTVSIHGHDTLDLSIRNKIGYQSDLQFRSSTLTVYEYLSIHCKLYNIDNMHERISDLLNEFKMTGSANKKLDALSKGMRQKIELIMAFLNQPELVVLDEPTAALDPPSVFELRDYITRYKTTGATILFSSHHLTEIEKICNRVLFIDSGKIAADVKIDENSAGFLEEAFRRYEQERKFI